MSLLVHFCPNCLKKLAIESDRLRVAKGVKLERRSGEAPRLKCVCGKVMILIKASL